MRPLLAERCYACHSAKSSKVRGGLRVDHTDLMLAGGESGVAIVPGAPDESLLIDAVNHGSLRMPPDGKLTSEEIAVLTRWVAEGAYWPASEIADAVMPTEEFDLQSRRSSHWAWQPVASPEPPKVADRGWPKGDIDRFVLAKMEAAGLTPAPAKDKYALLRRLYFDLIGLPPTRQQVETFAGDDSPESFERVVDGLLDSPRFGERWGRHWLDLVRYAESRGHEFDYDAPNAYQYRDYVIRAFNQDVPYDQFVREHIAGDLLKQPRLNPDQGYNESILGTGFWHLGEWVHSPVDTRKDEATRFDNMVDVMSKTFLGMTVACARCHDHKFDAISSRDYYALTGFLQSSDYRQVRFESLEHNRKVALKLAAIDRKFQDSLRQSIDGELSSREDVGGRAALTRSTADPPTATAANDPHNVRVLFDYAVAAPHEFMQDGFTFGQAIRQAGDLYLHHDGRHLELRVAQQASAAADPFWEILRNDSQPSVNGSGALDPATWSGRTLRTPTVMLDTGRVACLVRGGGQAFACVNSHRLLHGPLHGQNLVKFASPTDEDQRETEELHWVRLDLTLHAGSRVCFEFAPNADCGLEVLRIVEVAGDDSLPAPGARPVNLLRLSERLSASADTNLQIGAPLSLVTADPDQEIETAVAAQTARLIRQWNRERESLQAEVQQHSRLAIAMMECSAEDDRRLIRGDSASPAETVPRRFLETIDGPGPLVAGGGSGRLALADRVNAPDNPLTSRVIVNRIWQHLIGEGIVPTPDNFGVLGEAPTNPELLDFLAGEFDRNGKSVKSMIRSIVLSSTYRTSSQVDAKSAERDPDNDWLSHLPPKRLDAESIRDSLLLIAGKLDATPYGPSVPVHLTSFMQGRGRPKKNGPMDGAGRRSVYLEVRRNFLSPLGAAFDAPTPFSTMGRRTRSNVPAQALTLLNDPFVQDRARDWAEKTLSGEATTVDGLTKAFYYSGFGRPPSADELRLIARFVQDEAQQRRSDSRDVVVWTSVAHALINTKEFLFLQ
ncbi:PSD1 and planctomycete cytochrome C domain-containing protein [Pirellulimonas nuda]|uniref:PSD1 and planctomycete cytochrome C domain-containing protein n=1 Tax=Pirellulimonas nuda TaxID=2528009 RepID=UPI001E354FF4|nr:PSD1 and planctomycete cytochrome C domain-containing protein [Pirellulimonas nuda]